MESMCEYYILIKGDSYLKDGSHISAYQSILKLISANVWPLYARTAYRKKFKPGDKVVFYAAGRGKSSKSTVGHATVQSSQDWTKKHDNTCPLFIDEIPYTALTFNNFFIYETPIEIRPLIESLSFLPSNKKKWGISFMNGSRRIPKDDFKKLSKFNDTER